MDPRLKEAAMRGDVEYLRQALKSKPTNYFVRTTSHGYNIFHIAVRLSSIWGTTTFIQEAITRLPKDDVQILLSQQDTSVKWNPLHFAAFQGNLKEINLILDFYKTFSDQLNPHLQKPWLAIDVERKTPLHLTITSNNTDSEIQECGLQILSMDKKLLCDMEDYQGYNPFFLALARGFTKLALEMLASKKAFKCPQGFNLLHRLAQNSEVNFEEDNMKWQIEESLIKNNPELLDEMDEFNNSILHTWAKKSKMLQLNCLVENHRSTYFEKLSFQKNSQGNTPLHLAVEHGTEDFAWSLFRRCKLTEPPLWSYQNEDKKTPIDIALEQHREEFLGKCITFDHNIFTKPNSRSESQLFIAVNKGCNEVVKKICIYVSNNSSLLITIPTVNPNDGQTVLHVLSKCSEETGREVVNAFPGLINLADMNNETPLDRALEDCNMWLIEKLLEMKPDDISYSPTAWIKLCKSGKLEAIKFFAEKCASFKEHCHKHNESPLHHIMLKDLKDYEEFLAISSIWDMKNNRDSKGKTPLHLALEKEEIAFAEILLKKRVDHSIRDKNGKTARKLLADLSANKYKWRELCQRLKINPRLKTRYIQDTSALEKVRDTLAVVAALLATLTFAAGFTLPGGLNQETGESLLAKRASFLVFILADTYAMCSSMFVLFCLIWSMVCDEFESHVLIDRSVMALIHAFCGTLVAFMAGIYTVISQDSLWAAILIIVMVSLVGVTSWSKTFLYTVLDVLIPSSDQITETKPLFKQVSEQVVKLSGRKGFLSKRRTSRGDNIEADPLSNA